MQPACSSVPDESWQPEGGKGSDKVLTGAADTNWEGGPEAGEQMKKAITTGKANLESLQEKEQARHQQQGKGSRECDRSKMDRQEQSLEDTQEGCGQEAPSIQRRGSGTL